MTDIDRLVILVLESADSVRLQKLLRHTEQTGRSRQCGCTGSLGMAERCFKRLD
jgi:hypothetical protein